MSAVLTMLVADGLPLDLKEGDELIIEVHKPLPDGKITRSEAPTTS